MIDYKYTTEQEFSARLSHSFLKLGLSNLYDRMNTDTILDETFEVERYGEKSKTLPNFEQGNVTFPAGLSRRIVQDRLCVPRKWTTGMSDIKRAVDFSGCLFFKFDR